MRWGQHFLNLLWYLLDMNGHDRIRNNNWCANREGWGREISIVFFRKLRNVSALIVFIYELTSHLKFCFKEFVGEKTPKFSHAGPFMCCSWNVYRSVLTPRPCPTPYPEKFLCSQISLSFSTSSSFYFIYDFFK